MTQDRQNISSGVKWEDMVGYSRAVRVGSRIYIAGSTATDPDGRIVGKGDAYLQAAQAIRNIERCLAEVGATLENVVRTRMFVTDISSGRNMAAPIGSSFIQFVPLPRWSKFAH